MICVLLSTDIPEDSMDRTIFNAVQGARTSKHASIVVVFISDRASQVFKHRDVFTKYIDVGVRVYIENNLEVIKEIFARNCSKAYISASDTKSAELLKRIPINLTVHEV